MINSKQKVLTFASAITQNNKLHHDKKVNVMSSKFVIGNREKKEWISVLDTNEKELVFTGNLANARNIHRKKTPSTICQRSRIQATSETCRYT